MCAAGSRSPSPGPRSRPVPPRRSHPARRARPRRWSPRAGRRSDRGCQDCFERSGRSGSTPRPRVRRRDPRRGPRLARADPARAGSVARDRGAGPGTGGRPRHPRPHGPERHGPIIAFARELGPRGERQGEPAVLVRAAVGDDWHALGVRPAHQPDLGAVDRLAIPIHGRPFQSRRRGIREYRQYQRREDDHRPPRWLSVAREDAEVRTPSRSDPTSFGERGKGRTRPISMQPHRDITARLARGVCGSGDAALQYVAVTDRPPQAEPCPAR